MSTTNHSKRALKIMHHRIGIYMLRKNIAANVEEVQYRSDSLSINPACASGACTDFEYIECTIAIIDGIAQ